MKLAIVCVLALAFGLMGCASVDVTKTAKGFYEATNPNDVEILMTRPEKKYVELGSVTVSGFDPSETAKLHNAVRAKAAPLGANAVILLNQGLLPASFGPELWATGVAIRYTQAAPAATPTPAK
jgi:hypothetical protein